MKKCPYCAEEIQDEAIKCRHCSSDLSPDEPALQSGRMAPVSKKDRKVALVLVVVILGIAGYFGWTMTRGSLWSDVFNTGSKSDGRAALPALPVLREPVVTKAEYDRLQTGMSLSEAQRIIGASGEEMSRSEMAGTVTLMQSWTNPNGSNMNAMFQDDKLINKAQFGLP